MNKKLFIILYGKENQGKTSTLMNLVIKLGGGSPSLERSIKKTFLRNNRYMDGRFIIIYNDYIVYIATAWDTWYDCSCNTDFFKGIFNNKTLYLVNSGALKRMTTSDKEHYKEKAPKVVVSACRPHGDNYGAIKAIHFYSETHLIDYAEQLWLRKESGQNDMTLADEIKNRIDSF